MSLGAKTSTAEMVNAKLQIPLYLVLYPFMFQPAIYLYDCNPKLGGVT